MRTRNLTTIDDRVLFAANWDRGHPWHMLGVQARKDMGIEEGLELVGVAKEHVEPANLYTFDNDKIVYDDRGPMVFLDDLEEIEGKQGIKSNVFGVMDVRGINYEITQRREILELAFEIVGLDKDHAAIDTLGNGGDKAEIFFAYIKVPDLVVDPLGVADVVERGLFVGTSFNGTLPNIIGFTNIRVACSNALAMALPGLKQAIKVRHTKGAEDRMRIAAEALHYAGAVEKRFVKRAEEMLRVEDGDRMLDKLLDHFYPLGGTLGDSARDRRIIERGNIEGLYDGDGNRAVSLLGRNGYAAYQAFTDYVDHSRPVRARGGNETLVRARAAVMPGRWVDKKIMASKIVLGG